MLKKIAAIVCTLMAFATQAISADQAADREHGPADPEGTSRDTAGPGKAAASQPQQAAAPAKPSSWRVKGGGAMCRKSDAPVPPLIEYTDYSAPS